MGNVEIPKWLEGLPFAPEFRPSDTEFADPIAYISKIEKEASAYGICKIIPPLPKPSKRYAFAHLNKSLVKCPDLGDDVGLSNGCSTSRMGSGDCASDGEVRGVFTTRHQELGQSMKRMKGLVKENPDLGVQKQVWQSGEVYTLEQFESKSKTLARSLLGVIKEVNPSVIEALFWKAASEKPIYIEYANDVPGSAFGEPEGQFHYFRRQRRKRASYKSYRRGGEFSDCKRAEKDGIMNSHKGGNNSDVEIKDSLIGNAQTTSLEATMGPSAPSTSLSDETLRSLKHRNLNSGNEMEGTAGWKLSNCPWNLQVIARSPGSLTRFMPDDIPGVTSPMIYIGMLFSWFAWHVEDHELHSMNFLHTGSPKTWYAVPGDYAFAFEEVIRTEVYGGSIDRLAVLTLLGEKTTLLSPKVIVSSGIPCCRLIQNPGEFVVTFPRAYHVGFSHGFNCGEAANFGTPQWLKVAKDAAVRRAAMNYLPMLSHQQLLYLLTMSFVLRVPRSLLPGARSSRLRDRQKEDRELSVKKAFIEDIKNENDILSTLLGKDSTYHVKIWNPDVLPSARKESQLSSLTHTNLALTESDLHVHSEDCSNAIGKETNLSKEMTMYMENLNDLYEDNNDLSGDFQVDSGTLPCVACGILGFPFMTVIQPSERAMVELLPKDNNQEKPEVAGPDNSYLSRDPDGIANPSHLDDLHQLPNLSTLPNDLPFPRGWDSYRKFCRPRIFCLEHAVQIEELLQSKGGANLLVICHSDYQKMKAYAAAISEEIDSPFQYKEISLENASQEDLNLIDHAIDDEGPDECEDWTSILGVNLQYCVKVRKNSPSKKVKHALELGGLFGDRTPGSDFSDIRWQNRRSRSRIKLNPSAHSKPCDNVGKCKDEVSGIKSDNVIVKREEKLIQYSRRKHKVKRDCSTYPNQEYTNMRLQEVSVASCGSFHKQTGNIFESSLCKISISRSSSGLFEPDKTLHEVKIFDATGNVSLSSSSVVIGLPCTTAVVGKRNMVEIESQLWEESNMEGSGCNAAANGNVSKPSSGCDVAVDGDEMRRENKTVVNMNTINENGNSVFEGPDHVPTNMDICTHLHTDAASIDDKCEQQENFTAEEVLEEVESTSGVMLNDTNQPAVGSVGGSSETQLESSVEHNLCSGVSPESDMQRAILTTDESNKEHISCSFTRMDLDQPTSTSMAEESELLGRTSAQEVSFSGLTINGKVALEHVSMHSESDVEDPVLNSDAIKQQNVPVREKECFEIPAKNYDAEGLCAGVNLHIRLQQEIHSSDISCDDELQKRDHSTSSCITEPVRNRVSEIDQPTPASVHNLTVIEEESCNRENIVKSNEACLLPESTSVKPTIVYTRSIAGKSGIRKNEVEQRLENLDGFIRSPCEGLRSRAKKDATARNVVDVSRSADTNLVRKRASKPSGDSIICPKKRQILNRAHKCDLEGCHMSFETKVELRLHKRDRCTYEGCNKRFSSHRYALVHQRVHEDDRPLKCPWEGCSMSFKWAWARTEHVRVHTGEKPYQCKVEGCGLSFRFVSDYSRHRRKTGHYGDNSPA